MRERVVVAMSGGVDSSAAAGLLVRQGYEVVGITMCFSLPQVESRKPRCCGREGIDDARRVADLLGIRHYVVTMQAVLEEKVIRDFCLEYSRGRTPNPCVRCNQFIKFGALLKKARLLGARYLATGHYARILPGRAGYRLHRARDTAKDQSYFLYRLKPGQLRSILFPLGEYTKAEVRRMARQWQLPVAEKPESQEICFLPGLDYRSFLGSRMKLSPGPVKDRAGRVVGRHRGIGLYTIGQREGLGIPLGYRAYVTGIDAKRNVITVGRKEDALARECVVKCPAFLAPPHDAVAIKVKIRYNHDASPAQLIPLKAGKIRVRFRQPQFAMTPGQSAVFYSRDRVVGGGIIERVEK